MGDMETVPYDLIYDGLPLDDENNAAQLMAWNRYAAPFVYGDSLGRGGATQLRYAQTAQGSSALPGDADTGSGGAWRRQLGDLGQVDIPAGMICPEGTAWDFNTFKCQPGDLDPVLPGGFPPPGGQPPPPGTLPQIPPGTLPGVVTEQQCAQREAAAFAAGRDEERGNIIRTAAITAVVSGVVGIGLGYIFGR